ncbi:TrmH family RNA methyltransferase [Salinimicrobium sp. HB62]|uniref:TrmH family RNA methyltransferase n=1 Tax=Salinimicrobium sp. HB62 TaxID=3077781 RepID=UPI002D77251F|nr:RNA methyltransferase [Salinimicrobium sp. HB62]
MFSKSQIKLIKSLSQKKYRMKNGLFVIEGKKGIFELLNSSFKLHALYTTEDIFKAEEDRTFLISEADLKKISNLHTPQAALAVFQIPIPEVPDMKGLQLVLDEIKDPGNLGTIIRLCDWFGIRHLICSLETVDCYNPKVVQATMGSISRVNIHYCDISEYLTQAKTKKKIYGTFLEGENVYTKHLSSDGIIVLGNEANGISKEIENLISEKIHIPQFGAAQSTESLNVATAAAIFLSEFRRMSFTEK